MPPLPITAAQLLQIVSAHTTTFIVSCAVIHVLAFLWLRAWAGRDLRRMAHDFDSFTRELRHRSVLDRRLSLSDQIEAFLADVQEVLSNPAKTTERAALARRMQILDEERRYLQSQSFETTWTVCRTMIEAYPLLGVLGTILAIGAALQAEDADAAATMAAIVKNFGESIWASFAGLFSGILLMFLHSLLETKFTRLTENRAHVRETISHAKRELTLLTSPAT